MAETAAPCVSRGELPVGGAFERAPAAGECDAYEVALAAGEAVRFAVEQHGVDLETIAVDPAGEASPAVDGLTSVHGVEEGVLVAAAAGTHRLEITASPSPRAGASYRLTAEPPRPATRADRLAAEANRLYREGRDLSSPPGREDEALERLGRARRLFRQAGLHRGEAWASHAIGFLHRRRDDWGTAEAAFRRAGALYRESDEEYGAGRLCIELARVRRQLGDLDGAVRCVRSAQRAAVRFGDDTLRRKALAELGHALKEQGRPGDAIRTYSALLHGRAGLGSSEVYDVQVALGTLYLDAGEADAALARFEEALRAVRDDEDRRAEVLQSLGRARRELGLWGEAIGDLEQALAIFERRGDVRNAVETLNNLGLAHLGSGDLDAAEAALEEATARPLDDGGDSYETVLQVNLAKHALAVDDAPAALDHCRRALGLAEESAAADLHVSAGYCLARALFELGRLDEALTATAGYLELAEEARAERAHADHRAGYQDRKRHYYELPVFLHLALAERTSGAAAAGPHADAAFLAAERARARTLLEVLTAAGADLRGGLAPSRRRELEDAERRLGHLEERRRREEDAAERARLEPEIDAARELFRLLEEERRRSDPAYAELTEPEPVTLDQVQREVLDDETQLLVYFLGEEESRLWLIDRAEVSVHELPRAAEIDRQARQAVEQLATSGDFKARLRTGDAAAELARTVLAPVAARLRGPRLAIVADGALRAVPFGTLPLPAAGDEAVPAAGSPRLVERFEIVYPASVSVLRAQRRMRRERGPAPPRIAVLGDPVFTVDDERFAAAAGAPPSSRLAPASTAAEPARTSRGAADLHDGGRICADLRRLPHSGREAAAIAALAPETELRTGFAADRRWVLDGGLEGFGVLHFATHACVDPRRPELSGIALSTIDERGRPVEGMLRAHEIYGLRLSADLAVISACSSALGREVRGEGLLGITRGFLHAGVPRVVVSLWDVDDEATAELMTAFYRGLYGRGETPAAALTAAQREMAESARWSEPEHWAAFVVQGDWD